MILSKISDKDILYYFRRVYKPEEASKIISHNFADMSISHRLVEKIGNELSSIFSTKGLYSLGNDISYTSFHIYRNKLYTAGYYTEAKYAMQSKILAAFFIIYGEKVKIKNLRFYSQFEKVDWLIIIDVKTNKRIVFFENLPCP